eukprot:11860566-Alexandrium_andersonii.AAC.1
MRPSDAFLMSHWNQFVAGRTTTQATLIAAPGHTPPHTWQQRAADELGHAKVHAATRLGVSLVRTPGVPIASSPRRSRSEP